MAMKVRIRAVNVVANDDPAEADSWWVRLEDYERIVGVAQGENDKLTVYVAQDTVAGD